MWMAVAQKEEMERLQAEDIIEDANNESTPWNKTLHRYAIG